MFQSASSPILGRLALAVITIATAWLTTIYPAVAADRLRWPSHTYIVQPSTNWVGAPRWSDRPAPSPAIAPPAHAGERYDPVYQPRAALSYGQCKPGETCVKCVANCDSKPVVVVQKLDREHMTASRDPDGAAEALLDNGGWNSIRCYERGGCSATNVIAPRRIHRTYDVTFTYIRRTD